MLGRCLTAEISRRVLCTRFFTRELVVVALHFTHVAAAFALAEARDIRWNALGTRGVVLRLALAVRVAVRGRTPLDAVRVGRTRGRGPMAQQQQQRRRQY